MLVNINKLNVTHINELPSACPFIIPCSVINIAKIYLSQTILISFTFKHPNETETLPPVLGHNGLSNHDILLLWTNLDYEAHYRLRMQMNLYQKLSIAKSDYYSLFCLSLSY